MTTQAEVVSQLDFVKFAQWVEDLDYRVYVAKSLIEDCPVARYLRQQLNLTKRDYLSVYPGCIVFYSFDSAVDYQTIKTPDVFRDFVQQVDIFFGSGYEIPTQVMMSIVNTIMYLDQFSGKPSLRELDEAVRTSFRYYSDLVSDYGLGKVPENLVDDAYDSYRLLKNEFDERFPIHTVDLAPDSEIIPF